MGFFDKIFSGTIDDESKNIDNKEQLEQLDEELEELADFAEEADSDVESKKTGDKKGLFGKKKKKTRDDVVVDDLYEERKRVLNKYAAALAVGGIFVLMILAAYIVLTKEEIKERSRAKVEKSENAEGIEFQRSDLWKTRTSNKIQRLEHAIVEVKKSTKEELNATKHELIGAIATLGENIGERLEEMRAESEADTVEIKRRIVETKEELRDYTDKKIAEAVHATESRVNSEIAKKLVTIKKDGVKFSGDLSMLPPPPPLEGEKSGTAPGLPMPPSIGAVSFKGEKKADEKSGNPDQKKAIEQQKLYAKADVESVPVDTTVDYNATVPSKKVQEKEPPLHIMTGLAEATLITGVSAATFGEGVKSPKMVMLSIKGDLFGANDHTENLSDCLLFATATGNMNTKRAELLVTRLSCSIYDDGKYYKIEQTGNPLGWVIGEDGKYGLKGRLVSSAAEVVMRQLIVGFLQGVATAFATPSVGYIPQQYGGGTGQIVDGQQVLNNGISGGANTALNSLAEYYKEMLDGLYPYIDIKAGRRVSVIFMGFQDTTKTRYIPIDVTSDFGNEGDDFEEVEIEENDF